MPELPEVECTRRSLEPHVVGEVIASVRIGRSDVVGTRSGRSARTSPINAAMKRSLLEGARIARLDRRGKQMAIVGESGAGVIVHLGMSGRLVLTRDGEATPAHTHVQWTFARGGTYDGVRFTDPRRFGFLLPFTDSSQLAQIWSEVGPDALELDRRHPSATAAREEVARAISDTGRAIKPVLLDQRVVAGVGNIYADEACFAARLDPHRPGRSLSPVELDRLLDAVAATLLGAIACNGTTRRDYVDALGRRGEAQASHAVYDRAGKPCVVCGRSLSSDRLGQRATVWCARCQR